MTKDEVYQHLQQHIDSFWNGRPREMFSWKLGSMRRTFPAFQVVRYAPTRPAEAWVYVTIGAWEVSKSGPALEFVIMSPMETPRHVETLTMVAWFHADPTYGPLAAGSTIEIGRPWINGSLNDHLLVTLPYPFGPALERCQLDSLTIRILWLVPIHRSEAQFIQTRSVAAFEDLIEQAGYNILTADRPSVVPQ